MGICDVVESLDATYDSHEYYAEHIFNALRIDYKNLKPRELIKKLDGTLVALKSLIERTGNSSPKIVQFTDGVGKTSVFLTRLVAHRISKPLLFMYQQTVAQSLQEYVEAVDYACEIFSEECLLLYDELHMDPLAGVCIIPCVTFEGTDVFRHGGVINTNSNEFKKKGIAYVPDNVAHRSLLKSKCTGEELFPVVVSPEHYMAKQVTSSGNKYMAIISDINVPVKIKGGAMSN